MIFEETARAAATRLLNQMGVTDEMPLDEKRRRLNEWLSAEGNTASEGVLNQFRERNLL